MKSLKCSECGLVNSSDDITCRRCGTETGKRRASTVRQLSPREAAKKSSWIYTILFIAVIIGAASYLFKGVEKSYDQVNANELNRAKSQPTPQPAGLSTREESDRKQIGSYNNAMQKASGLKEGQKHVDETKKLMQAEPDKANK